MKSTMQKKNSKQEQFISKLIKNLILLEQSTQNQNIKRATRSLYLLLLREKL